jgi:hypothetical protein
LKSTSSAAAVSIPAVADRASGSFASAACRIGCAADRSRHAGEGCDGGDEGFRRRDALFRAGIEAENDIGLFRKRAVGDVDDGDRRRPALLRRLLQRDDIGARTRLRDGEMDAALQMQGSAIDRSDRRADRGDRNAAGDLEEIFEEGGGMVRGAARRRRHHARASGRKQPGDFGKDRLFLFEKRGHHLGRLAGFLQHQ